MVALIALGAVLYASTSAGRQQVGGLVAPLQSTLLASRSGQRAVYQTGPRPTPVGLAQTILPTTIWQKLLVSLFIDLLGSATYLLPGIGEALDIGWAPLQTVLIMAMYDRTSPKLKYVSFVEEILPFTDIIPSATVGWMLEFGPPLIARTTGISEQTQNQVLGMLNPPPPSTKRPATAPMTASTATPNLTATAR